MALASQEITATATVLASVTDGTTYALRIPHGQVCFQAVATAKPDEGTVTKNEFIGGDHGVTVLFSVAAGEDCYVWHSPTDGDFNVTYEEAAT